MRGFHFLVAAMFAASTATAQKTPDGGPQVMLTPTEIAAEPSFTPGAGTSGIGSIRMTLLYGDPERPGPYTIALTIPPNTIIAAHTHGDARTAVVVRGSWTFGYGMKSGLAGTRTLPPGSFYSEPAGIPHYARTGRAETIVYITGNGPSDTHFVE